MPVHVLIYVGVVVAIMLLPGPDMALTTKNALLHGRPAALGSAFGVNAGIAVWTLATAIGLAAALRASETAYTVLKLVGAAYLIWLGVQAWLESRRAHDPEPELEARGRYGARTGFRQGVLSNLGNPKVAVFFTSLLPQFLDTHAAALPQLLLLGLIFVALNTRSWSASRWPPRERPQHCANRA